MWEAKVIAVAVMFWFTENFNEGRHVINDCTKGSLHPNPV